MLPGDVAQRPAARSWRNLDPASVPTGTKRRCEIQGQERHQGTPAELTPKRYPNTTNRQGVVCPVRDTMGLFQAALWPDFS